MRILICATQFKGGSLQVILSLIHEFKNFPEHEFVVVMSRQVDSQINRLSFSKNFVFISMPNSIDGWCAKWKRAKWLSHIEKDYNPDVVLTTSGPLYWKPTKPLLMGYNLPAYIYPESPFWDNKMSIKRRILWKIKTLYHRHRFRKEATAYFVQTDDVRDRLKVFLNKKEVYTISNTYSNVFCKEFQFHEKLPKRTNDELRFLTVCSYYPHKNLEIIPKVADELERRGYNNFCFILTISKNDYEKHFKSEHDKRHITNIGPIKSIECPSLYKECDIMFLPTLLECFSASYAEAMVSEIPIITSDLGFAHIVCHEAALYFNPMDVVDIVDKIELIIKSPEIKMSLIEEGKKQLSSFGTAHDRAKRIIELLTQIKK